MVTNVTSLTGNGLKDWLIQRATAVYLACYMVFLLGYCVSHPYVDYNQWHSLFHGSVMQIATIVTLIAVLFHAWIGIWTVTTDYMKCTVLRLMLQGAVALGLISQVIWGFMIVWGR